MDEGRKEVTMGKYALPNFEFPDSEIYDDSSYRISLPSQPPDIRNWFSSYESQHLIDSIKDVGFPHITELNDSETQDPFEDSRKRKLQEPCLSPEKIQPDLSKDTFATDNTLNSTMKEISGKKNTGTDSVSVKKKQSLRQILGDEFLASCQKIIIDQSHSPEKKTISPRRDNHEESDRSELKVKTGKEEIKKKCQEVSLTNSEQMKEDRIHRTPEKPYESTTESGFISLKRPKLHGDTENETDKNRLKSPLNFGNEGHDQVGCRKPLVAKTDPANKDRDGGFRGASVNRPDFSIEAVPTELSSGKWQCPRKGKPYVGPPMKQLRIGQWIRRAS
ncbi:ATP-dependent caseinolytic protease/crotonase family protein [Rhynchospora pubera]|uniref:ATP-dependent caseinolytic protease/crotonase family protein n=1 Tax=Rhynchospora pubera TaxID=906938 RepID=A0AAV8BW99_9POAL|nr:ATP-dependent caseinolytic protease/crotonase family protein [Rhynchospora pubera]